MVGAISASQNAAFLVGVQQAPLPSVLVSCVIMSVPRSEPWVSAKLSTPTTAGAATAIIKRRKTSTGSLHFKPEAGDKVYDINPMQRHSATPCVPFLRIGTCDSSHKKLIRRWKKICLDLARSAQISTTPPRLHHVPPPATFVCLAMSSGSELPETLRAQIVVLVLRGDSWAKIGAFLGITPDTVRETFLRWEKAKCYTSSPRPGRPKSLDERDIRHLTRHITANRDTRRQALGEIKNALNLPVCSKTLRTVITKDIGLGHIIERKKPWLRPVQRRHG